MARQLKGRMDELESERERVQTAIRRTGDSIVATGTDRAALIGIVVQSAVDGVAASVGRASVRETPAGRSSARRPSATRAGLADVLDAAEDEVLETREGAEVARRGPLRDVASRCTSPTTARRSSGSSPSPARAGPSPRRIATSSTTWPGRRRCRSRTSTCRRPCSARRSRTGSPASSTTAASRRSWRVEVERAKRFEQPLGLVMLDLDDFKQVNDQLRPPAGRPGAARGRARAARHLARDRRAGPLRRRGDGRRASADRPRGRAPSSPSDCASASRRSRSPSSAARASCGSPRRSASPRCPIRRRRTRTPSSRQRTPRSTGPSGSARIAWSEPGSLSAYGHARRRHPSAPRAQAARRRSRTPRSTSSSRRPSVPCAVSRPRGASAAAPGGAARRGRGRAPAPAGREAVRCRRGRAGPTPVVPEPDPTPGRRPWPRSSWLEDEPVAPEVPPQPTREFTAEDVKDAAGGAPRLRRTTSPRTRRATTSSRRRRTSCRRRRSTIVSGSSRSRRATSTSTSSTRGSRERSGPRGVPSARPWSSWGRLPVPRAPGADGPDRRDAGAREGETFRAGLLHPRWIGWPESTLGASRSPTCARDRKRPTTVQATGRSVGQVAAHPRCAEHALDAQRVRRHAQRARRRPAARDDTSP